MGCIVSMPQNRPRRSELQLVEPCYKQDVREISVSKFKSTCLAVVEDVRRTKVPVRLMRYGKPVAEIFPASARNSERRLGGMRDSMALVGDIVGPIGAFAQWKRP